MPAGLDDGSDVFVMEEETVAMSSGIQDFNVEYEDGCRGHIRRITIEFGDHHRLEVVDQDKQVSLRLQNGSASVALDASGPLCQYERAVNLLRLHMPDVTGI